MAEPQFLVSDISDAGYEEWTTFRSSRGHRIHWTADGSPGERKVVRERRAGEQDLGLGELPFCIGLYRCGPAKFEIETHNDEVVLTLEGSAVVEFENGDTIAVKAGDIHSFPRGQVTTWTVSDNWTELFFVLGEL